MSTRLKPLKTVTDLSPAHGAEVLAACATTDPKVAALANDVIGRIADKWTMIILETLTEHGALRFTRLGVLVEGISQKMLTQTLRQMERDGLINRKIYPVVPPKVEYRLTELGVSLGAAFCGVWLWAEANLEKIEASRQEFDNRAPI
ncbi:MAG: winged helix-turn-helix transcriptional regulator [Notoacmeibacter sp.]